MIMCSVSYVVFEEKKELSTLTGMLSIEDKVIILLLIAHAQGLLWSFLSVFYHCNCYVRTSFMD